MTKYGIVSYNKFDLRVDLCESGRNYTTYSENQSVRKTARLQILKIWLQIHSII